MSLPCNLPVRFCQEEVNDTQRGDRLMNASEKDECPRCGTVISGPPTEKLCPACLISGALTASGDETASRRRDRATVAVRAHGVPPRVRRLPAAGIARARRHGHGLRGRAPRHRPPPRPEDARAGARFAGHAAALPPRGPPRGAGQPPEQPLHLRQRGDRGRPGHHDGDCRQRHAQGRAQAARPAPGGRGGRRGPRRHLRPRVRLRGRRAAPRHQALQLLRLARTAR